MHEEIIRGVSNEVSLDQIERADRIRALVSETRKRITKRRRGHKGTRTWGYQTPGGARHRRD